MEDEDSRDKLEINIMLRTVNTGTAVSVKALLDSGATGLARGRLTWRLDFDCLCVGFSVGVGASVGVSVGVSLCLSYVV